MYPTSIYQINGLRTSMDLEVLWHLAVPAYPTKWGRPGLGPLGLEQLVLVGKLFKAPPMCEDLCDIRRSKATQRLGMRHHVRQKTRAPIAVRLKYGRNHTLQRNWHILHFSQRFPHLKSE